MSKVVGINGAVAVSAASLVDPERLLGLEFIRATEGAALSAYKWMGKGDKESADFAACDAIRGEHRPRGGELPRGADVDPTPSRT